MRGEHSVDPRRRAVRDHFDSEADAYDDLIPRLIPGYFEQEREILAAIPFVHEMPIRVADLGCGTGALSRTVLDAFPAATLAGFDIAPGMIEACRERLAGFGGRVSLSLADIDGDDLGGPYDVVVSGLAIHHLEDESKRRLFRRVLEALEPDGVFLIREIVLGETAEETERLHAGWRSFMRDNGVDDAHWFEKYLHEDRPTSLRAQLAWLEEAGFDDVRALWSRLNFAVFGGRRSRPRT